MFSIFIIYFSWLILYVAVLCLYVFRNLNRNSSWSGIVLTLDSWTKSLQDDRGIGNGREFVDLLSRSRDLFHCLQVSVSVSRDRL